MKGKKHSKREETVKGKKHSKGCPKNASGRRHATVSKRRPRHRDLVGATFGACPREAIKARQSRRHGHFITHNSPAAHKLGNAPSILVVPYYAATNSTNLLLVLSCR